MPLFDHHLLSLLIRWVHIASMSVVLGGASLVWWLSVRPRNEDPDGHVRTLLYVARRFEWLFWMAIGLLVMTGIGNLGAFGSRLPGRDTLWGERLTVKLCAVLVFILLSVQRTFLVTRLASSGPVQATRARSVVRGAYAVTTLSVACIAGLAVLLAHG